MEFVLLLISFCLFFWFLRDVVTRQTKQLPPKSLQIKGAVARDGKKRKTNHHCWILNALEVVVDRRSSFVMLFLVV